MRRLLLERVHASIVGVAHCIAIDLVAMGSCTRELNPRVRCLGIITHRLEFYRGGETQAFGGETQAFGIVPPMMSRR